MEIKFEDIKYANESIITTDIKGKDYAEVNQRVKAFRMVYPTGFIKTNLIGNQDGVCIFEAKVGYYNDAVYENKQFKEEIVLATGTAYEKENSTFINKTSYIENCETSAVGRALGNAGIGIDTSVASAEEVQNAILQQDENKKITKTQVDALYDLIKNHGVENDEVLATLKEKGYDKLADIKIKDYFGIVKHFESFVRE